MADDKMNHSDQPAQATRSQNTRPAPSRKPFKRAPAKIDRSQLPKPTHITSKETKLTNDPLWKDSFVIDGESGFVSEAAAAEFEADAAGYIHLIDQEYRAISDVDKFYAKSVSSSAHAYYHTLLYWYKIGLILQKRGTSSIDMDKLVAFVDGYGTAQIAAGAGFSVSIHYKNRYYTIY